MHFLELFLALKINSKKNYPSGLGRALGSTCPHPLRTRPCGQPARPSPSGRVSHGLHGQGATAIGLGRVRPYKGQRRAARPCPGSPPSLRRSAAGRRKTAPPPHAHRAGSPNPAAGVDLQFRPLPSSSARGEPPPSCSSSPPLSVLRPS
jgi:hypothetical protein